MYKGMGSQKKKAEYSQIHSFIWSQPPSCGYYGTFKLTLLFLTRRYIRKKPTEDKKNQINKHNCGQIVIITVLSIFGNILDIYCRLQSVEILFSTLFDTVFLKKQLERFRCLTKLKLTLKNPLRQILNLLQWQ